MRRQRRRAVLSAAVAALGFALGPVDAFAQATGPSNWTNGGGTGQWLDGANWAGGVPNAFNATAIFPAIGAGQFILVPQTGVTVGSMLFTGGINYTFNAVPGTVGLTLDGVTGGSITSSGPGNGTSSTTLFNTGVNFVSFGRIVNANPFNQMIFNSTVNVGAAGLIVGGSEVYFRRSFTGLGTTIDFNLTGNAYIGDPLLPSASNSTFNVNSGIVHLLSGDAVGAGGAPITVRGNATLSLDFVGVQKRGVRLAAGGTLTSTGVATSVGGGLLLPDDNSVVRVNAGGEVLSFANFAYASNVTVNVNATGTGGAVVLPSVLTALTPGNTLAFNVSAGSLVLPYAFTQPAVDIRVSNSTLVLSGPTTFNTLMLGGPSAVVTASEVGSVLNPTWTTIASAVSYWNATVTTGDPFFVSSPVQFATNSTFVVGTPGAPVNLALTGPVSGPGSVKWNISAGSTLTAYPGVAGYNSSSANVVGVLGIKAPVYLGFVNLLDGGTAYAETPTVFTNNFTVSTPLTQGTVISPFNFSSLLNVALRNSTLNIGTAAQPSYIELAGVSPGPLSNGTFNVAPGSILRVSNPFGLTNSTTVLNGGVTQLLIPVVDAPIKLLPGSQLGYNHTTFATTHQGPIVVSGPGASTAFSRPSGPYNLTYSSIVFDSPGSTSLNFTTGAGSFINFTAPITATQPGAEIALRFADVTTQFAAGSLFNHTSLYYTGTNSTLNLPSGPTSPGSLHINTTLNLRLPENAGQGDQPPKWNLSTFLSPNAGVRVYGPTGFNYTTTLLGDVSYGQNATYIFHPNADTQGTTQFGPGSLLATPGINSTFNASVPYGRVKWAMNTTDPISVNLTVGTPAGGPIGPAASLTVGVPVASFNELRFSNSTLLLGGPGLSGVTIESGNFLVGNNVTFAASGAPGSPTTLSLPQIAFQVLNPTSNIGAPGAGGVVYLSQAPTGAPGGVTWNVGYGATLAGPADIVNINSTTILQNDGRLAVPGRIDGKVRLVVGLSVGGALVSTATPTTVAGSVLLDPDAVLKIQDGPGGPGVVIIDGPNPDVDVIQWGDNSTLITSVSSLFYKSVLNPTANIEVIGGSLYVTTPAARGIGGVKGNGTISLSAGGLRGGGDPAAFAPIPVGVVVTGGTIDPGDGSAFGGNPTAVLQFGAGLRAVSGKFHFELGSLPAGPSYDQLIITGGGLNLGNSTVTLELAGSLTPTDASAGVASRTDGDIWLILNNTTGPTVGEFAGLADGSVVPFDGLVFNIYYHADFATGDITGGNDVLLRPSGVVVPEPAGAAVIMAAAPLLARRRRR